MTSIVLHGHFYQPPREEPWLELVPRERSAAPDHDWNVRITRECYEPLAAAGVTDVNGDIIDVLNLYAYCSFDIGPTLLRWLDANAPWVRDAMIAGDKHSRERVGVGNAIAMPYHHIILPLASRRDKVTEVRWGIRDFERRFGRKPEGMWLPETAVDHETLEVLCDEGIQFTVLAPGQVRNAAAHGRPGWWHGAGDRKLAIFTYDGMLAADTAFTDITADPDRWLRRIVDAPRPNDGGLSLRCIATDGETFGHHHKSGAAGLAALIAKLQHRSDATVTNFGATLAAFPPQSEIELVSPSSWSCAHGIERWRSDCGCRMDPHTSQAWRAPLRVALDTLAAGINSAINSAWPAGAGDFSALRDLSVPYSSDDAALPAPARTLLEADAHALAMFTSCAWFFDDLGRVEPRIVLRHAARALELVGADARARLEPELLATLASAHSNDAAKGDGAAIYQRDVLREANGEARLAAGIAAMRELAPDALDDVQMPAHDWQLDGDDVVVIHRRTAQSARFHTVPVTLGVIANRVHVRDVDSGEVMVVTSRSYPGPIRDTMAEIARALVFDAAPPAGRATMDPLALVQQSLEHAWSLVASDGIDQADAVLHAVLDLYDLHDEPIPAAARAAAFVRLSDMPWTPARDMLAERFGIGR